MSQSMKHQDNDRKETKVIVFVSMIKDERGQFTVSLMPASYLEKRYGEELRYPKPCSLLN